MISELLVEATKHEPSTLARQWPHPVSAVHMDFVVQDLPLIGGQFVEDRRKQTRLTRLQPRPDMRIRSLALKVLGPQ